MRVTMTTVCTATVRETWELEVPARVYAEHVYDDDILGVLDDEHTVVVSVIDKVYDEEDRAVLAVEVD